MAEPAELWERLGTLPGLCRGCLHAHLLASARSVFLRCNLSDYDPAFPRYPPLPVFVCEGYVRGVERSGAGRD